MCLCYFSLSVLFYFAKDTNKYIPITISFLKKNLTLQVENIISLYDVSNIWRIPLLLKVGYYLKLGISNLLRAIFKSSF